jgi:hypothetical protein
MEEEEEERGGHDQPPPMIKSVDEEHATSFYICKVVEVLI